MQIPPSSSFHDSGLVASESVGLLPAARIQTENICPNCQGTHVAAWPDLKPFLQGQKFVTGQLSALLQALWDECCRFQQYCQAAQVKDHLNQFFSLLTSPNNARQQVQEYVQELMVSHQYLNKICKAQLGMPLHLLVVQRNLLVIKLELLANPAPLQMVCEQLGYADLPNFSKFFKKQVGFSPAMYRDLLLVTEKK